MTSILRARVWIGLSVAVVGAPVAAAQAQVAPETASVLPSAADPKPAGSQAPQAVVVALEKRAEASGNSQPQSRVPNTQSGKGASEGIPAFPAPK